MSAVFELCSVAYCRQYAEADRRANNGTITRDDYIRENFRLEFSAAQRARAVYIDLFASVIKEEGQVSNSELWFFYDAYLGNWQRGLTFFKDKKQYPWRVYGEAFDKQVNPM